MNSIFKKTENAFQKCFVSIVKVKRNFICLFFLTTVNNLWAQQNDVYIDPYFVEGVPGYNEILKAQDYEEANDLKSARIWYEKGALKGNLYALTILANMAVRGIGGPANVSKGLEYFNIAIEKGYPVACYLLAVLYYDGEYITQDLERTFILSKMCMIADETFINGKVLLGLCYTRGIGTPKDIAKGIELLKETALAGDGVSQYSLADIYYYEIDFRNYEEAAKWYSIAMTSNSDLDAQNQLAYMYAKGEGVEQNYAKAHFLVLDAISKSKIQYKTNPEKLSEIQSSLLGTEGAIYLMENKANEAMSIWNQIKQKYPELVEKNKYNPQSRFIRIMYKQEQDAMLASKTNAEQVTPAIISDVDERIPENSIVGTPTFVVIIANESYKEVEGVPYAMHDGEIFKQYCEKTLGIPKSNIKFEKDATFNTIKRQLSWLGQVMDVYQGEANIIFYYAGHGIPDEKNQSAYLLPVDGYGSDVTTAYSLDKLYADLSDKPAKSVMVLLDACFSGAKRDGGMLASARGVAIKAKQNAPKGNMVVFSAAQGDETAYPYKEKGHGMFTYYLMKKLQETKGEVTFGELADYVTSEVKKQSIVVNGKMQTPLVSSSSDVTDWQNWKLR